MNILFITVDQWRGECLSALGHAQIKTPHLDAFATGGVTFKRHFAQATPCGPSRACIYTGMYLQNHRSLLNGTPLDARHTNVALEACKSGYRPVLFGHTDSCPDPRLFGSGEHLPGGFEAALPGMKPIVLTTDEWKPWRADLAAKGYQMPKEALGIFEAQSAYPGSDGKGKTFAPARYKAEDSNTAFLTGKAIEYISENRDTPWFVHLSLFSPHPPFVVPEPFHDLYDAEQTPLPIRRGTPQEEAAQHPWLEHFLFNQLGDPYTYGANSRDNLSISEQDLRQIRATYYGMISEVDAQIGRLLDHLKQIGGFDDTFIIVTSDHGEQLGDHWMLGKFSYFEQTFHIPLIIYDPTPGANRSRGTTVGAVAGSIDLMPTILEAIGVDIPRQCDGYSLLPFCRGAQTPNWRREYHAEFDLRIPDGFGEDLPLGLGVKQCAVNIIRGDRYKYVHFAGLPPLFFDLEEDPNEFHDLSGDAAYQGQMLEYAQKMISWRMEHDEPALTNLHVKNDGTVQKLQAT